MKAWQMLCVGAVATALSACSYVGLKGDPDERWADYKSWHKITADKPGTGDPTSLIGNVHMGREGYRDVYVNEAGKAALTGSAPYDFPVGTVVVKEQFKDKAAWEAQKGAGVTVSLKIAEGTGAATNWHWADSYTSTAGDSAFCSGCHTAAIASDFVFTHADFLATQ